VREEASRCRNGQVKKSISEKPINLISLVELALGRQERYLGKWTCEYHFPFSYLVQVLVKTFPRIVGSEGNQLLNCVPSHVQGERWLSCIFMEIEVIICNDYLFSHNSSFTFSF